MRTVAEHQARVRALGVGSRPHLVAVEDAVGTVLAEDISAPLAVPAFDVSAVDGFAVRMSDLHDGLHLHVRGPRVAGPVTDPQLEVTAGTAIQIMTGAQVPPGTEAVVPVEATSGFVEDFTTGRVTIACPVQRGANIRRRGDDIAAGERVLDAGTRLSPNRIGAVSALGRSHVRVRAGLRVAVVSTGNELVRPGEDIRCGQIFESNAAMLAADLAECGVTVHRRTPSADDIDSLRKVLSHCAESVDMIITTGGVSAGTEDVVRLTLQGAGVEFGAVAMKPGRPQGAGHVDGVPIVCLPGNPVSSFVSYEVFIRPVVRAALGHRDVCRPHLDVPLLSEIAPGRRGHTRFLLGVLGDGGVTVGESSSGSIRALADSDCIVETDDTGVACGSTLRVWVLDPRGRSAR